MTEIKKAILNWRMAAAVLLAFMVLMNPFLLNHMWTYMAEMDVLDLITTPMATSGFTPFACVFPMIPYGLCFVEEYNSNYIRFVLPRYGRKQYILWKIVSSLLAGGCVTAAAFSLVFLIFLMGGRPVTPDSISEFYLDTIWEPYLLVWGGKLVLLLKTALAFLHGAVWSLTALLVSAIYTNRYAAIVFPFVIYQISWHLLQGRAINPVYLLRGDWGLYSALYVPFVIQGFVILLLVILNAVFLWRKCNGH